MLFLKVNLKDICSSKQGSLNTGSLQKILSVVHMTFVLKYIGNTSHWLYTNFRTLLEKKATGSLIAYVLHSLIKYDQNLDINVKGL